VGKNRILKGVYMNQLIKMDEEYRKWIDSIIRSARCIVKKKARPETGEKQGESLLCKKRMENGDPQQEIRFRSIRSNKTNLKQEGGRK
jgi:hypothetical protein